VLGVSASCKEADAAAVQVHAHRWSVGGCAVVAQEQQVRRLPTIASLIDLICDSAKQPGVTWTDLQATRVQHTARAASWRAAQCGAQAAPTSLKRRTRPIPRRPPPSTPSTVACSVPTRGASPGCTGARSSARLWKGLSLLQRPPFGAAFRFLCDDKQGSGWDHLRWSGDSSACGQACLSANVCSRSLHCDTFKHPSCDYGNSWQVSPQPT